MEITNYLEFVKNISDFRDWLEINCLKENHCFVGIRMGKPKADKNLYYLDAVEEALCFGWIDSVFKKTDGGDLTVRFVQRRRNNSNWTELNKERARRLIRLEKMTKHGEAFLPDLKKQFVIDEDILEVLHNDKVLWANFLKLPKLYIRIRIDNIQNRRVRRSEELFWRRLKKFVDATKNGVLYGAWDDYGRLSGD